MPDFDKNLKPILKNQESHLPDLDNPATTGNFGYRQSVAGRQSATDQFFGDGPVINEMAPTVTAKELYENRRYEIFSPDITDIENQKAYAQPWTTKAANGILKGLNLTATTVIGGFGMLEGSLEAAFSGRLADIWDNKIMRDLDDWNNKVDQEYLPNYYTTKETEANWYSTDNWFTPNFLFDKLIKNSGYAVGAMISGNIANAGLKAAGAGIGALADTYAVTAESSQAFKAATPLLRNISRAFSAGKNIEAAQALEKGIASIADITAQSSELANIAAQTNRFFKINDIGRRTAVAAYSSAGEASFEALQTSREYRKNAISQFTQTYGYEPTGQDLERINQDSESVGKVSFFANMAILGATEYVQLPKILGSSYAAEKQAANSLMGKVDNVVLKEGKYVAQEAATKFGKLYDKAKGIGRYAFDPKEALQEGLQYQVQVGVQNYYNKAYQTGNGDVWVDGFLYGLNGVKDGKGVGVLNSKEGAESMLLGGITGGMMQIRGNIAESRATSNNTKAFLDTLNNTPSFKEAFQDRLNSVNRGVMLQQQQQAAIVQGDRLEATDLNSDMLHNYLSTRIKYGRFDMIMEDIKELRQDGITEGGLSQLKEQGFANINDTVESYQQRLSNFETVAKNTNELYKSLDLRYSGEVDEKGNRKYSNQVIDKMAYAGSKIMNYDKRIPQVNESLVNAGIDTTPVLTSLIKENKPNAEATESVIDQINSMDITSEMKDDLKLALTDVIELSLRRKLFIDQYDDIKANPEKYQVSVPIVEPELGSVEIEQEEESKIKRRELNVGQEYSLKQSYVRDGNGLILAPKLTVQAQTLGGEYEIKLPNGKTSFVTPEQFKAYKISDANNTSEEISDLLDNVITRIISQPKYKDIADTAPAGEESEKTLLEHINQQNNSELIDEIEAEFKERVDKFMKEAEQIAKDDKLAKELNATLDTANVELAGTVDASSSDSAKPTEVIPRATIPSKQIPGYRNSNFFGNKLNSFPNRKNIRGVYVTQANEAKLGLGGTIVDGKYVGGLMNHLKGDSDIDPAKTIAFVMVEQVGDKLTVVDKNGKPLDKPTVDNAVYQVMPDPKFQWSEKYGGKSMFREDTSKETIDHITSMYTEWVNETLDETELIPHTIEASFGNAEKTKGAKNSVVSADLIKASELNERGVLYIPTTNGTIRRGSTSFSNPLGKIFLKAANGYVMLQNNQHNEKQAKVIFDAIRQLCYIANTEHNLQSDDAQRLYNWLTTVVYWGKPKNAPGVNSMWFERGKLFMGNEGVSYTFTTEGLDAAKDRIIADIQKTYHNVRSVFVASDLKTNSIDNWNLPYEQILGVVDGKLEVKQWKNYQSYLLSAQGRNSEDIPLTTNMNVVENEDEVNRQGVYFVATDMADRYAAPLPKVKAPKTLTPGSPKADVANAINDGEVSTISNPAFGTVHFIANFNNLDEIEFIVADDANPDSAKMAADNAAAFAKVEAGIIAASIAQKIRNEQVAIKEEAAVVAPIIKENEISESDEELMRRQMGEMEDDAPFRTKLQTQEETFEKENWPKVEKFLKEKFPNLPVYRVKNIIRNAAGQEMFGMFKDGAIYVYEGAETGTLYHEVFHGVYRMFTSPEERNNIREEFRARTGSFTDRATGEEIEHSAATDIQIEEQLAEELIDYIQNGKIPGKPKDGRPFILKLFSDFVNFIKSLFKNNKSKLDTAELFRQIKKGDFKQYSPVTSSLSYANKGIIDIDSVVAGAGAIARVKLGGQTVHDIMQQMTYITLRDIVGNNQSLFNIEKIKKPELYAKLKDDLQKTALKSRKSAEKLVRDGKFTQEQADPIVEKSIALWKDITDNWEDIVEKHTEYLKSYSIQFDENEEMGFRDEDRSKTSDYLDSSKIDSFKKAAAAIKLLLSTVPIVRNGKLDYSSINGARLLSVSEVYMTLLNQTHSARTVDEMIARIYDIAKNDENYRTLYERITKSKFVDNNFDLSNLKNTHDGQLISALWKVLKKQNPEVKNLFILENGEVQVGASNFGTAARQLSATYTNAVVNSIKTTPKYFKYDPKETSFVPVRDDKGVAAIEDVNLDTIDNQRRFLGSLGISFTKNDYDTLDTEDQTRFQEAVKGIKTSFVQAKKITNFSGKTLSIKGRLMTLAELKVKLANPEFDSTFYNINGEMTQTFLGINAASNLFDTLSQIEKKSDLANTPYAYLLTDSFAQNSVILNMMFNPETGNKIQGSEELMKTSWADGTQNAINGKKKSSSKLTYKDRLIQEINMNLAGYYYTLIPGDASLEWQTYMKNAISAKRLTSGFEDVYDIFRGYFISEMNLSREDRPTKNQKELRFFKPILGETLHNKLIGLEESPEEIYANNKEAIDKAVLAFIDKKTTSFKNTLERYGVITPGLGRQTWEVTNLEFAQGGNISEQNLNRELTALSVNFMINNIELHKLLFSDPYQYSDELKRIKNFLSPRQAIISNSANMNNALNNVWNENYTQGDIGYTDFTKDYFKTVTIADVNAFHDLPGYKPADTEETKDKEWQPYEESDGSGIIMFNAYRNFKIRSSDWTDENEKQYQYDVAWEKRDKGLRLSESDKKALAARNPNVKSTYTAIKPIVSGNKANDQSYNDIVLDKFALYPLSYRILKEINMAGGKETSNAIEHYNKMQAEGVDYSIFKSGRKVGAQEQHELYKNGEFNTDPYAKDTIVNVPFNIMAVQSEVPSKDVEVVTRGSQITKLATMDFMEAGVPVDFEKGKDINSRYEKWFKLTEDQKIAKSKLYKEIKNNQDLLEAMMEEGYQNLLRQMGIVENADKTFSIDNNDKVGETLRKEILKREVNDNIADALAGFLEGHTVLEATPAYQQIRNILYSIADREVISPKISGGMKVQIPSTLFEEIKGRATEINGKQAYESDVLNFYVDKNGKRVCEIMLARWFESPMSDKDLLDYLNNTDEGKEILAGIGFRIPTQKQNSIDSFVIKQFLPKEFGDNVVIPSALVKKAGSDFDIDKLSVYLKNVYDDGKGNVKLVPFYSLDEKSKAKFGDIFDEIANNKKELTETKIEKFGNLQQLLGNVILGTASDKQINKWIPIFKNMFGEDMTATDVENALMIRLEKAGKNLDKLNDADLQAALKEEFIEKMYGKSLENAYIQSLQNLISSPENFSALIQPNSADQLKGLAKEITGKLGFDSFNYSSLDNMLDRHFMSRLRQAFVSGKYAIGIAARNQTNHSLNQRQLIYLDTSKISQEDEYWLKDGAITFENYNKIVVKGKEYATVSMINNVDGQRISDINAQFIDGYVDISKGPWIMELGATPNVTSTWMFLSSIGVPIDTVAYFMNQPIIRDYLAKVENAGYSWLFIEDYVKEVKALNKYSVGKNYDFSKIKTIPSKEELRKTVGAIGRDLDRDQKAEQQFMLDEFLKYAKMASQMFTFSQGTNFDTATFNDPYLVFKKMEQLKRAQNTIFSSLDENGNPISGVDNLLKNSFLGKLAEKIGDIRNAYAEILKSDAPNVRQVIENTLGEFIDMPDSDFIRVSQKAVSDLFDWAVQIDRRLNTQITNILLAKDNVAGELSDFLTEVKNTPNHPLRNNQIIKLLDPIINGSEEGVNNAKINNKSNKVYDQNQIIYGFDELKNYLETQGSPLYGKIVRLAVLQSGLSNSPISFTSLLPYEDFKEIYNKTLSNLEKMPNLADFNKLKVFQRNNWNDSDIVPMRKARRIKTTEGSYVQNNINFGSNHVATGAILSGEIPQLLKMSSLSREAQSDVVVYSWEQVPPGKKKYDMIKEGDFSYIKKGLFQKVYSGNTPISFLNKFGTPTYVYKMINAWGDSRRVGENYFSANEFYAVAKKSVIDNGFIKSNEVEDDAITPYFSAAPETIVSTKPKIQDELVDENTQIQSQEESELEAEALEEQLSNKKINIYAGTGENAELSNFANRPFTIGGVNYTSVEQAFQHAKLAFVDSNEQNAKVAEDIMKANGATAKSLGRKFSGFDTKEWNNQSSSIMKTLLKQSFEQNPSALRTLLETGNAELTHTQDRSKWGRKFPALLMEVREELAPKVPGMAIVSSGKVKLKDNKYHNIADINSKYLSELGFSKKDINNILKEICKLG